MDEKQSRLIRKLRGELGPVVVAALDDSAVVEVVRNPDGRIWVERLGEPMRVAGEMSSPNARSLLGTVAASLDTEVTPESPVVEGELILDGSRFEGLLPPVVASPAFAIRKRASSVIPLAEYVSGGVMTSWQASAIEAAVAAKQNILVAGGTGSGKTTLVNAVLQVMATQHERERLVIIEDTVEIQCAAPNAVSLSTSGSVGMAELLRATLRLRPDRIVVGEVRGAEALTLLKAWCTGHAGGVGTVHAASGRATLTRLEHLVAESGTSGGVEALIGEAVDLVVVIERTPTGRRVTELLRVRGFADGAYICEPANEERGERA